MKHHDSWVNLERALIKAGEVGLKKRGRKRERETETVLVLPKKLLHYLAVGTPVVGLNFDKKKKKKLIITELRIFFHNCIQILSFLKLINECKMELTMNDLKYNILLFSLAVFLYVSLIHTTLTQP